VVGTKDGCDEVEADGSGNNVDWCCARTGVEVEAEAEATDDAASDAKASSFF
jgi:hypothetical protein